MQDGKLLESAAALSWCKLCEYSVANGNMLHGTASSLDYTSSFEAGNKGPGRHFVAMIDHIAVAGIGGNGVDLNDNFVFSELGEIESSCD